ncbi:MAG: hypothetical protein RR528_06905, partial [Angelakisella sp.]
MAITTNIYSYKANGQVIFTGNTLGLAGVGPNNEGFLNFPLANVPAPNGNTTMDWTMQSSAAKLALPLNAQVLHAELMWASCLMLPNNQNLIIYQDDPINFIDSNGNLTKVTPRIDTASNFLYNGNEYFIGRTATVTDLVQAGGAGLYTVGHIPCVLSNPNNWSIVQEDTHCGWALYVAYQLDTEDFRNLNIYYFGGGNVPGHVVLNNIQTPMTGPVDAHLLLSVGNGNSTRDGDQVWFGPTDATLTQLSTPNNLPNNFFASQINDRNGILDTTGTFGGNNVIPGLSPQTGDREYWDLTGVDVSPLMLNDQTTAVLDIRSISSDGLAILGGAIQIREQVYPVNPIKTASISEIDPAVGATVTFNVDYFIDPATAYAPTARINVQDVIDSRLTVVSSSLDLPPSTLYTITNLSSGNTIEYRIVSSVPTGEFLPPTFTMTITATIPPQVQPSFPIVKPCIKNIATMTVDNNAPLYSNAVYISFKASQAVIDIIESVALEQTALAHILNAEGEKIQKIVVMPGATQP